MFDNLVCDQFAVLVSYIVSLSGRTGAVIVSFRNVSLEMLLMNNVVRNNVAMETIEILVLS